MSLPFADCSIDFKVDSAKILQSKDLVNIVRSKIFRELKLHESG